MYPMLYGMDALFTILLLILWWIAGSKAGRLLYSKTQKRLKRQARSIFVLFAVSLLFVAGKIATAGEIYA